MPFWNLEQHGARIALIDGEQSLDFTALARLADAHAARLPDGRGMGLLCMPSHVDAVALYLGALRCGRQVPLLLQPDTDPQLLGSLVEHYQPDWVASPGQAAKGYRTVYSGQVLSLHVRDAAPAPDAPHPDLALLLSTSGSTGSSKLVRLSSTGLDANASAIVDYLGLRADDRAITTLPLAYSFGMSILNSHLAVGGSVVLSEDSLMTREFWDSARRHHITSLSGVPATFEILRRMGLARLQLPSLRMLTQAGGRLRDELVAHFAESSQAHGLEFFVMYGQTEASPRISYVPAARIIDKVGSIGVPVPGGRMQVDATTGELIYSGPNVMMGYAATRADLAKGDELQGVLRTGDLARVDEDGFHYITGRAKRFLKISGNRVNLDEVEAMLSAALSQQIVCSGSDDDLVAFSHGAHIAEQAQVRQLVQERYKLFGGHIRTLHLDALPLMASGKVDYQSLRQMAGQGAAR
ncbi:AMP-binding protein [Stenotrophomonas maltophilia group sp. RNC7]|uniref:AMP-binding protein n=1 Tax=Stenotrophomonas maltophilia group sp. RNC7 TaxID=3071467 RepID=UPI0027DF29FA|nr:AMP-binding protein [Stenotrophomonas maltophilia group sp. RNC7]MDQ4681057.1 AMP-binding protein [Stenotrophomonas maltophilia group sp. RNC7]